MLKINEIFETIQGEGTFTGVPSIFVRLQGCPVGCPWCDTQHTWTIDAQNLVSVDQIVQKVGDQNTWCESDSEQLLSLFTKHGYTARHVVITGGEPCMYDLTEFTHALNTAGFSTQIETSGTFEILCSEQTWVTVSPKINMPGGYSILQQAMQRANEIKHPIAMQKHIDELDELLQQAPVTEGTQIALQPISQIQRATDLAIKTCIERNWRLSLQTHKYLGIE